MTTTNPERRKRLALLTQADRERIEPQGPHFIGFVEPAPPYCAEPRRLPAWAKHLRHLRPLQLVQ